MMNRDIGSKFKELFGHGAVYGIGSALQAMLGFILLPLYTKNLTPEMYGTWALIILCGTVAGVVFYMGVSSALARSFYDYPEGQDRKAVVNTALLLTSGGAIAQITMGVLFGEQLSLAVFGTVDYSTHVEIALTGSAFGFVNQLFYVVLRFERRSREVVLLNLASLASGIGIIVYLLLGRRMGVMAPVLGDAINQVVLMTALAWSCRHWLGGGFCRREIGVQFGYGIPMALAGLMYYLHTAGDRFWIKKFCDLSDVGIYALAARIGMLVQVLLIMPFGQIWTPIRLEMKDQPGAGNFFGRVLTYYLLAGIFFAFLLSVFSSEVVALLARNNEYGPAVKAVPFVVCAHLIYGAASILDAGIIFSRKAYVTALMAVVALAVNAGANVFLLPRLGFIGAGCSLVVSMSVYTAGIYLLAHRLFPVVVEFRRVGLGILFFVVGLLATIYLENLPTLFVLPAKLTIVACLAVSFVGGILDDIERRSATAIVSGGTAKIRSSVRQFISR